MGIMMPKSVGYRRLRYSAHIDLRVSQDVMINGAGAVHDVSVMLPPDPAGPHKHHRFETKFRCCARERKRRFFVLPIVHWWASRNLVSNSCAAVVSGHLLVKKRCE